MHDLHGWAPQATQVSNQWRQDGYPPLIAGAKVSAGLSPAGSWDHKLGCLAQTSASWGPSLMHGLFWLLMSNNVHYFLWDAITHPWANFSVGLEKQLLKSEYARIITYHGKNDVITVECR